MEDFDLVILLYPTLLKTFKAAVAAFNGQKWKQLEDFLDDNVILNRIDDTTGTDSLIGKVDVSNYLENDVAGDTPQFNPIDPIEVNGRTGTVSGTAMWEDNDTDPVTGKVTHTSRKISYIFVFSLHKSQGKWLIVNLYGSPD